MAEMNISVRVCRELRDLDSLPFFKSSEKSDFRSWQITENNNNSVVFTVQLIIFLVPCIMLVIFGLLITVHISSNLSGLNVWIAEDLPTMLIISFASRRRQVCPWYSYKRGYGNCKHSLPEWWHEYQNSPARCNPATFYLPFDPKMFCFYLSWYSFIFPPSKIRA